MSPSVALPKSSVRISSSRTAYLPPAESVGSWRAKPTRSAHRLEGRPPTSTLGVRREGRGEADERKVSGVRNAGRQLQTLLRPLRLHGSFSRGCRPCASTRMGEPSGDLGRARGSGRAGVHPPRPRGHPAGPRADEGGVPPPLPPPRTLGGGACGGLRAPRHGELHQGVRQAPGPLGAASPVAQAPPIGEEARRWRPLDRCGGPSVRPSVPSPRGGLPGHLCRVPRGEARAPRECGSPQERVSRLGSLRPTCP